MENNLYFSFSEVENKLAELISQVKTSENQLTNTIRSAIENLLHVKFIAHLKKLIAENNESLKKTCNAHYETLINSLSELNVLHNSFSNLRKEIASIVKDVADIGLSAQNQTTNYELLKVAAANASETTKLLEKCIPIFEIFIKLNKFISDRDTQTALSYYRLLVSEILPSMRSFSFVDTLNQIIPMYRELIKQETRAELLVFLEKARDAAFSIGQTAIDQQQKKYANLENNNNNTSNKLSAVNFCYQNKYGLLDALDFTAFFRYESIMQDIGDDNNDPIYYRNQRYFQARILFEWNKPGKVTVTSNNNNNTETTTDRTKAFTDYIYQVTGFFILESFVAQNSEYGFSKTQLSDMFDRCVQRLFFQMQDIHSFPQMEQIIVVKKLLSGFASVFTSINLSSPTLKDCENLLKVSYNKVIGRDAKQFLHENKLAASHTAGMVIHNKEELTELEFLPLPNILNDERYPKKLPFSSLVPFLYKETVKFVGYSMKFGADSNKSQTEHDREYDQKFAAKYFLSSVVQPHLLEVMSECKNVFHFIQLYYDVYFMDSYLTFLDSHIGKLFTKSHTVSYINLHDLSNNNSVSTNAKAFSSISLKDSTIFSGILAEIEQNIINILLSQVEEFIDKKLYKKDKKNKVDNNNEKSGLLLFIGKAVEMLKHLPKTTSCHIYIQMIKSVNMTYMDRLMDNTSVVVTTPLLAKVLHDVNELDEFVQDSKYENLHQDAKQLLLAELKQTVILLTSNDWGYFFENYKNEESKFCNVQLRKLTKIYARLHQLNMVSTPQKTDKLKDAFKSFIKTGPASPDVALRELVDPSKLKPQEIFQRLQSMQK